MAKTEKPKLPHAGDFKPGNQWWKQRATHGRERIFKEPQILLEAALEYFEKTDERKWNKIDFRGKNSKEVKIPNETPYTLSGLCLFLSVNTHYFSDFENSLDIKVKRDRDFSAVIRTIREIIWTQKFEGATVGAFNANIIAQELGLKTKIENDIKITAPLFAEDGEDGLLEDE